jgi:glucose-6-phosphate isomerase
MPGPREVTDMRVDIGNALAATADPGLSDVELDAIDERVADAHERIARGRADDEFGYAALNLPDRADPAAVRRAVEGFDPAAVLTVGIGGSALGAVTLTQALGGDSSVDHYALDNVDPAHIDRLLGRLPLNETVVHVVSRSGTTAETLANFLVVRDAMDAAGVDWTERTVVTTGDEGPLRALADRHDLPALDTPEGVPGRFSALSTVGLVPAALQGVDLDALLDGGRAGADALAGSLRECPAYAYGAVTHELDQKGATVNAVMPYAESLEAFAEWFAQLWAESLGKDGGGQTPVRALGATDQHSQLQLYRAGRRDKLVTFVRPRERPSRPIPETDVADLSYLGGENLGTLLDAEFEATEASLAAAGRPNVRVEIPRVDAESVGRLLYDMESACVLVGELAGVETFTQPAVEWGKRAARGLLGGDFAEAEAVHEKTEFVVE